MIRTPERRDELIHDAALDADKCVLSALRQQRQLLAENVELVEQLEGVAGGDLQRRRRGEARAAWHIACDQQVRAAERVASSHKRLSYAADVVAPRVRRAVLDRVEREVVLVGDDRGDEPNPIVVTWAGGDIRRA